MIGADKRLWLDGPLFIMQINSKVDLAEDWKMDHGDDMEILCAGELIV